MWQWLVAFLIHFLHIVGTWHGSDEQCFIKFSGWIVTVATIALDLLRDRHKTIFKKGRVQCSCITANIEVLAFTVEILFSLMQLIDFFHLITRVSDTDYGDLGIYWIVLLQAKKIYVWCKNFIYTGLTPVLGSWGSGSLGLFYAGPTWSRLGWHPPRSRDMPHTGSAWIQVSQHSLGC